MKTVEQVRYLLLAAQREGNRRLAALLSQLDLTPAQSEALRILADHGPLALKELGDMLVCDTGTSPSRLVDRLVLAGLVQREADVRDRRQVVLAVTPQGSEKAAHVQRIEEQFYEMVSGVLDAHDLDDLARMLRILTHGSPAGDALDKRLAAEEPR